LAAGPERRTLTYGSDHQRARDQEHITMTTNFLTRKIENNYANFSQSEKQLATDFLNNVQTLPFDTIGMIASRVGLSEMTVIRFIRSLGYKNFKDLKADLRKATSQRDVDDVLERHKLHKGFSQTLKESLDLEIKSLIDAYTQTQTDNWKEIIRLLASVNKVYVVGFQSSKGLALDFSTRLKYVRKGVNFVENTSGIFLDIFGESARDSCIILIDTVEYSTDSFKLSDVAREADFPLVVITDRFSHWPYEYTSHVLQVSTHVKMFWDSTVGLAALSNLIINSVAATIGKKAEQRFGQTIKLNDVFKSFSEKPQSKG
jgi:DNA-binding MurR/RpiR family transcriptional regulator